MDDFGTRFESFIRLGALLAAGVHSDDPLEQREIAEDHFHYIRTGEVERAASADARRAACQYTQEAIAKAKKGGTK